MRNGWVSLVCSFRFNTVLKGAAHKARPLTSGTEICVLLHPDYTVGSGMAPDLLTLLPVKAQGARGLMERIPITAGGESHPAPRTPN